VPSTDGPDPRRPDDDVRAAGSLRADRDLPPPARTTTPVPDVDPADESARQTAATVRSVSRLEEAN
jgi:hypothetical protein